MFREFYNMRPPLRSVTALLMSFLRSFVNVRVCVHVCAWGALGNEDNTEAFSSSRFRTIRAQTPEKVFFFVVVRWHFPVKALPSPLVWDSETGVQACWTCHSQAHEHVTSPIVQSLEHTRTRKVLASLWKKQLESCTTPSNREAYCFDSSFWGEHLEFKCLNKRFLEFTGAFKAFEKTFEIVTKHTSKLH